MGVETLAIASIVSTVVGTGLSAVGQVQQSQAQNASFKYQAAVARNNQIIANRMAEDARKRGELEANIQRQKSRQLQGAQRAALASSGVLVDQDTAADVVADTAALGELDALTIRSNAEREALGFEAQGMNFASEAGLAQSKIDPSGGLIRAGSTLLTGLGSVASKWHGFNTEGVSS